LARPLILSLVLLIVHSSCCYYGETTAQPIDGSAIGANFRFRAFGSQAQGATTLPRLLWGALKRKNPPVRAGSL
jgi:hypothetical protein